MAESRDTRRGFLKAATLAIGGLMGAVVAFPLVRYVFFPVRRRVIADAGEPIDAIAESALVPGAAPTRVELKASGVRNAWAVADDVPLGAAWVRKTESGEVEALSGLCPHLGCAVDYDGERQSFRCPCHKSAFGVDGAKLSGPSKRGLDPLPVKVEDGRVRITFVRYRPDISERKPV